MAGGVMTRLITSIWCIRDAILFSRGRAAVRSSMYSGAPLRTDCGWKIPCRAAETFALECGVKGPQWLEIGGVSVSSSKKSFCQHEFAVPELRGNLQVLTELPPPTLRVLSLELSAITRPDSNQTQVCAAAAAVYEGIDIVRDTDRTHQNPVRGCSVRMTATSDG